MRHLPWIVAVALLFGTVSTLARDTRAQADRLIGTWAGTFDGESSGHFGMAISRDTSKNLTGSIDVAPEMGDGYTANFTSIEVDGDAVTLSYATGDGDTVKLEGTLDGTTIKGSWNVFEQGTTTSVLSGDFTTTRR